METEFYDTYSALGEDYWWFAGRRAVLSNIIPRKNGQLILDVGSGAGINLDFLSSFGEAIGSEPATEALSDVAPGSGKQLIRASAASLPFPDASVDVVTALDVIEHIEDDIAVIFEFKRVLKDGGALILTVPAFKFLWSYHDEINHHKRRYEKKQLVGRVTSAGLEVERSGYFFFFLFPLVAAVRLLRCYLKCSKKVDARMPDSFFNKLLTALMSVEARLIKYTELPFGSSIYLKAIKR